MISASNSAIKRRQNECNGRFTCVLYVVLVQAWGDVLTSSLSSFPLDSLLLSCAERRAYQTGGFCLDSARLSLSVMLHSKRTTSQRLRRPSTTSGCTSCVTSTWYGSPRALAKKKTNQPNTECWYCSKRMMSSGLESVCSALVFSSSGKCETSVH